MTDQSLLAFYEDFYAKGDWPYAEEAVGRKLVAAAMQKAGKACHAARILDLGCGTGYYAKFFAEQGGYVVGLDFSMRALKATKAHAAIPVIRADAGQLPFRKGTFDLLFCSGLSLFNTDDLPRIRALFGTYRSCLRPGGVLLFLSASDFSGHPSDDSSIRSARSDGH